MNLYDPQNKRLIYLGTEASPTFWDNHWKADSHSIFEIINKKNTFVINNTKKFLKPDDGILLEGGCGNGQNVASLTHCGYNCVGIDWAEKTVSLLNKYAPELDIRPGDVRKLPFPDDFFIGYWSLGVIEHFWEGWEPIALEMARVIKNNGYLFLSFPYMSPLRRLKARCKLYGLWDNKRPDNFYAFILSEQKVIDDFQLLGFKHIRSIPHSSIKGTKDEISILRPILQKLYDYKGSNRFVTRFRDIFSIAVAPVASYSILLIFKKSPS